MRTLSYLEAIITLGLVSFITIGCGADTVFTSNDLDLEREAVRGIENNENEKQQHPDSTDVDDGWVKIPKPGEENPPEQYGLYTLKSDIPAHEETIQGEEVTRPLSILFLLDVTGSMSSQIATVKNNINAFVDNLTDLKYQVKIGLIAFRDNIADTTDLSSDLTAFKNTVSLLKATGGGDAEEYSLGAIEMGLEVLSKQETNPDAVRVMMMITDNPGHREPLDKAAAGKRDCTIDITKSAFAKVPAYLHKNTKLFYSVPSSGNCSGYNARSQMDALLAGVFPTVEQSKRGGYIAWPFSSSALLSTLPSMIKYATPPSQLICLADKISFSINGTNVQYASTFSKEYQKYKDVKTTSLTKDVSSYDIPADLIGVNLEANVTKKCFRYADAEDNKFNSPIKSVNDKLSYMIVRN